MGDVTPRERRRGVGGALVGAFAARARLDGCSTLAVEAPPERSDGVAVDTVLRGLGLLPEGEGRTRYVSGVGQVARTRLRG